MSTPAKICENCRHWCVATLNHRSTCILKKRQRYTYPEKLGDPHGWAPREAACFEERPAGAPMFAVKPRDRWNGPKPAAPGMAAARGRKERA